MGIELNRDSASYFGSWIGSVLGQLTDPAVITDAVGSISSKLRGLVALISTRIPVLGAAAPAASMPVVQDTTGAWTVVEASAATIAGDTTSIDGKTPALGPALAAASLPVIQASDSPQGRINAKGNTPVQITIANANSTQSAALPVGNYIVTSNIDVAILAGSNPTALTTSDPLWAYSYRRVVIGTADDKVAAIRRVASTGTVTLTLEG